MTGGVAGRCSLRPRSSRRNPANESLPSRPRPLLPWCDGSRLSNAHFKRRWRCCLLPFAAWSPAAPEWPTSQPPLSRPCRPRGSSSSRSTFGRCSRTVAWSVTATRNRGAYSSIRAPACLPAATADRRSRRATRTAACWCRPCAMRTSQRCRPKASCPTTPSPSWKPGSRWAPPGPTTVRRSPSATRARGPRSALGVSADHEAAAADCHQ